MTTKETKPMLHHPFLELEPTDGELIRKQDVIAAIVEWTVEDRPDVEMPTDLIGRIRNIPSAQPEIIWCKDCKYSEEDEDEHGIVDRWCRIWAETCTDDGYCNYAERV